MAQYRALRRHWMGTYTAEEGQVVSYDGVPGRWLEPLDADAKKAVADAEKQRAERRKLIDKGELPDEVVNTGALADPAPGPTLIKSHPILPNLAGSSGEHTGESAIASAEAKAKLPEPAAGAATRGKAPRRKRGKAKAADRRPKKPQGATVVSPDEQ
jgi:MoxR-like ATPase